MSDVWAIVAGPLRQLACGALTIFIVRDLIGISSVYLSVPLGFILFSTLQRVSSVALPWYLGGAGARPSFYTRPVPPIKGLDFLMGPSVPVGHEFAHDRKAVVVVEMWATWCPPCRASIPHINRIASKYQDKDVYIVGVTSETDVAQVKRFLDGIEDGALAYSIAIDTLGEARRHLLTPSGAMGIPHAIVIGVYNTVVWSGHPMSPEFERKIQEEAMYATYRDHKAPLVPRESSSSSGDDKVSRKSLPYDDDKKKKDMMDCSSGVCVLES